MNIHCVQTRDMVTVPVRGKLPRAQVILSLFQFFFGVIEFRFDSLKDRVYGWIEKSRTKLGAGGILGLF